MQKVMHWTGSEWLMLCENLPAVRMTAQTVIGPLVASILMPGWAPCYPADTAAHLAENAAFRAMGRERFPAWAQIALDETKGN